MSIVDLSFVNKKDPLRLQRIDLGKLVIEAIHPNLSRFLGKLRCKSSERVVTFARHSFKCQTLTKKKNSE
jgi:hypothetical protein